MTENSPTNPVNSFDAKKFAIEKVCGSSNLYKNLREVIESHPDESAKNLGMSIFYLINGEPDKMLECLEFLEHNHPNISLINRRIVTIP